MPILAAGLIGAAGSIAMFNGPVPVTVGTSSPTARKAPIPDLVCDREIRRSSNLRLVHSLLESEPICEAPRYFALKERIASRIEELKRQGQLVTASVYTRDFHNGGWIVIGDSTTYRPGNLLALPCAMAALSVSEYEPGFLQRSVTYQGTQAGSSVAVSELIRKVIVEKDENARAALKKVIPEERTAQFLTDLELQSLEPSTITIRGCSRVMLSLMNAASLSPTDSDKVLDLLAGTTPRNGLPAGVPGDVTVAHLVQEGSVDAAFEYHDSGIVFGPQGPYILTVMTRGTTPDALPGIVSGISRMVYEEMKAARTRDGV